MCLVPCLPRKIYLHFWQGAECIVPVTKNDAWTSKSGPNVARFWKYCQFDTFWAAPLPKVLRWNVFTFFSWKWASATVACTFSTARLVAVFLVFDFQTLLAPQQRAICDFSSSHMAPHTPLHQACFSTLQSHRTLETKQGFATFLPCREPCSSFYWLLILSLSLLQLLTPLLLHLPKVGSLTSTLPSTKASLIYDRTTKTQQKTVETTSQKQQQDLECGCPQF